MSIKNNTATLQNILNTINSLTEFDDEGVNTSDATAEAGEIFKDEIAYAKGNKLTGTFTIDNELEAQSSLITQIQSAITNKIAGSGDNAYEAMIKKTITHIESDMVQKISKYAFCSCSKLTAVSFPVCTSIGNWAFTSCSNLVSISFPKCTNVGRDAFNWCRSLMTVSFPTCTYIGDWAFYTCTHLTDVSLPACKAITDCAFCNCRNLKTISLPVCIELTGSRVFGNCSSLTEIILPSCTVICKEAFADCTNLTTVTLARASVCSLTHSNAFTNTPIARGTGYIYVPHILVSTYQSATNWAYYSTQISAIAGSENWDMQDLPKLITFTIDNVQYQAEEGMTWAGWCFTSYNVDKYYTDNAGRIFKGGSVTLADAYGSDTIVNGISYETYDSGWGPII